MTPQETDRWLIDGDCKKCRRKDYCAKECTKSKRWFKEAVQKLVEKKTGIDVAKEAIRKASSTLEG